MRLRLIKQVTRTDTHAVSLATLFTLPAPGLHETLFTTHVKRLKETADVAIYLESSDYHGYK